MSGMFWIALKVSIPKIGINIMLSLPVEKLDAFKFDGVAESENTAQQCWKESKMPTNTKVLNQLRKSTICSTPPN